MCIYIYTYSLCCIYFLCRDSSVPGGFDWQRVSNAERWCTLCRYPNGAVEQIYIYIYMFIYIIVYIYMYHWTPLQCRQMSVMVLQVTSCLFDSSAWIAKKNYINAPHNRPFVGGIHLSLVDSLHKGPGVRKAFPCHDVILCKIRCQSNR